MLAEFVDLVVSVVRVVLLAGLCWGAWLSYGPRLSPDALPSQLERFASLALLMLLLTTLGALVHAV